MPTTLKAKTAVNVPIFAAVAKVIISSLEMSRRIRPARCDKIAPFIRSTVNLFWNIELRVQKRTIEEGPFLNPHGNYGSVRRRLERLTQLDQLDKQKAVL